MGISSDQLIEILIRIAKKEPVRQIAQQFNCHVSTIYRRVQIYRETKRTGRKKSTRTKKLSLAQETNIVNLWKSNPFLTAEEIKFRLRLQVCSRTVDKCLRLRGINRRVSARKFLINEANKELRLQVAIRRSYWPQAYWNKIVFTDESGCDNSGYQRRHVYRKRGDRFNNDFIYHHHNKTGRLNYFSWVSINGVGQLYFYERMDQILYCEIVTDMVQKLRREFGHDDFLIIHDNAKFSDSNYTVRFMRQRDLSRYFVRIPPYSPDMNIIENMWAILKSLLKEHCFTYGQTQFGAPFRRLAERKWRQIPQITIDNLYTSLNTRMRKIVEARGASTKY